MKKKSDSSEEYVKVLKYVVIIATIVGIVTVAVIFIQAKSESYSALYLNDYSNYVENGTVSFNYGVDRFGPAGASYDLLVYLDDNEITSKSFTMDPGTANGTISFQLNTTDFPVEVVLVLNEDSGASYDVHFWLKGNR